MSERQIVPSEWALSPQAFQWVVSQSPWDSLQVDLFANAMNHRLPPTSVLLPMSGPGSVGNRRVEKRLARRGYVLFSSGLRAISVSTTLPGEDGPEDSARSSVVSPSAVGAPSEQSVREALPSLSIVAGASASASLGLPSSGSTSATPLTVFRRQRMKDQGFSDRVVDRIQKLINRVNKAILLTNLVKCAFCENDKMLF